MAVAGGVGVGSGVAVLVGVDVRVGTGSGVAVLVGVDVRVGTRVGVAVGLGDAVTVAVEVTSCRGALVAVAVGGATVGFGVTVAACWANTQPVATISTRAGIQENTLSRKKISPMRAEPLGYDTLLVNAFGIRTVEGLIKLAVSQLSGSPHLFYH